MPYKWFLDVRVSLVGAMAAIRDARIVSGFLCLSSYLYERYMREGVHMNGL